MAEKFVIDRFEGEYGVCVSEDQSSIDVPKSLLCGMREGDIFLAEEREGKLAEIKYLPDESEKRRTLADEKLRAIVDRKRKNQI